MPSIASFAAAVAAAMPAEGIHGGVAYAATLSKLTD